MRFDNNNQAVIKRITKRSMREGRMRNFFVIMAIVLTTFMISSVFSIGISFSKNYQTMNTRIVGTVANVTLNNPTEQQIKKIQSLDVAKHVGYEINAGRVKLDQLDKNQTKVYLRYYDAVNFHDLRTPSIGEIEGDYPVREDEIMISRTALDFLGQSQAKIGEQITIPYEMNGERVEQTFTISGLYTTYSIAKQRVGYILVSEVFVEANSISLEESGTLFMQLSSGNKDTAPDLFEKEVTLQPGQQFSYNYDYSNDNMQTTLIAVGMAVCVTLFIMISGYLLIYNVLYIAVIKDIQFYGLLKTIGASPKQIRRIVKGQAFRLSIVGIGIGLILGAIASFVAVPSAMGTFGYEGAMPTEVSFNPIIFIVAALFSFITVILSCRKPAKIAGNISPIEAIRYTGDLGKKKKKARNTTNGGKIYKMAWYNVIRDKKRAVIVFLSLFMGVVTFLSVATFLGSIRVDHYIKQYVINDFEVSASQSFREEDDGEGLFVKDNVLTDAFIQDVKQLTGVRTVEVFQSSYLPIELNEAVIVPALKEVYARFGESETAVNDFLQHAKKNPDLRTAPIIGVEAAIIERYNQGKEDQIDLEAFQRGDLVILDSWYYGANYKEISGEITVKNRSFNVQVVKDSKGILAANLAAPLGIPTVYMSQSALKQLDNQASNHIIYINVDPDYELEISGQLKNMVSSRPLALDSKLEATEEFNKTQLVMNVLGGGIAVILIVIGILNFINVMITSVNTRLKELAILESIGMTKGQIKRMLTMEGCYYAGVITALVLSIGIGLVLVISKLTQQIVDYAIFYIPAGGFIGMIIIMFAVCLFTPGIVFGVLSKESVTTRLREIEK